jgi:hypothetical protein
MPEDAKPRILRQSGKRRERVLLFHISIIIEVLHAVKWDACLLRCR